MAGKQHKREAKRQKEAVRQAARRAERQRTVFTIIVILVVMALGGVLVYLSIDRPVDVADQPTATPTAPTGAPTPPADVVPEDPAGAPGIPLDSGEAAVVGDAPVACGGEEPENAGDNRPRYPGGPAQVVQVGVDYRAVIETSCGRVVIDLYEDGAPKTVNSFVFLAQQGFFDGLEIFRNATSIGALQTGSGTNQATWGIGYALPDELAAAEEEAYTPGSVAMANSGPNSGGSQFFFVYNESFALPPSYAKFGMVVEGLDVLQQIGAIAAGGDSGETPSERVYMESVTIETGAGPTEGATPAATGTAAPGEPTGAAATGAPTGAPTAPTGAPATATPAPTTDPTTTES